MQPRLRIWPWNESISSYHYIWWPVWISNIIIRLDIRHLYNGYRNSLKLEQTLKLWIRKRRKSSCEECGVVFIVNTPLGLLLWPGTDRFMKGIILKHLWNEPPWEVDEVLPFSPEAVHVPSGKCIKTGWGFVWNFVHHLSLPGKQVLYLFAVEASAKCNQNKSLRVVQQYGKSLKC